MTLSSYLTHFFFDVLAVLTAIALGVICYYWRFKFHLENTIRQVDRRYFFYLSFGTTLGAYLFGSLNLALSGEWILARSLMGGIAGAVFMVELYKWQRGIQGSTGYMYVIPMAVCITIGRIGCFLVGLEDHTVGTTTQLSIGWDFGDGVKRHPVQLYESASMFIFLLLGLFYLWLNPKHFIRYSFYIFIAFYAGQRFFWEFLKPYSTLALNLNIFQWLSLVLIIYSIYMMQKNKKGLLNAQSHS